jgi:hypothetical protein
MDFRKRMQKVSKDTIFELDDKGFLVWCGTMVKGDDELYYLYFSFWPKNKSHAAWVTHSKVGYATSNSLTGPFEYKGIALAGAGGKEWDRDVIHNPVVIKYEGKYYMYYMGNYGNGDFWSHRNNQRIGVSYSEKPEGPWHRLDYPIIDITPNSYDSLMTSNPAVTVGKDGRIYMIYKAVSDQGVLPKGGAVICGIAIADNPLGPFLKQPHPIMQNPENEWSVEDPSLWYEEDRFYALVEDFQGYFTKEGKNEVALFESFDAIDWKPSAIPLGFKREITWEDGEVQRLEAMERPQILLDENGKPQVLLCACTFEGDKERKYSFITPIPIK